MNSSLKKKKHFDGILKKPFQPHCCTSFNNISNENVSYVPLYGNVVDLRALALMCRVSIH